MCLHVCLSDTSLAVRVQSGMKAGLPHVRMVSVCVSVCFYIFGCSVKEEQAGC